MRAGEVAARVLRRALPLGLVLCCGTALAQIEVEPSGGPLTLEEDVMAAFEAWTAAFDETLEQPEARVAYAPGLLGPETASLTLRHGDGRTEVLLSPSLIGSGPVLVHEVGLLLGVPARMSGVMAPALGEGAPTTPTESDVEALRDVRAYPPADITRDGVVDFYDLAALGAAFGSVGVNLEADLDGNGRVDDNDIVLLREAYAFGEPSRTPPADANLGPEIEPVAPPPEDGADETGEDSAGGDAPAAPGDDDTDPDDDAEDDAPAEPGDGTGDAPDDGAGESGGTD